MLLDLLLQFRMQSKKKKNYRFRIWKKKKTLKRWGNTLVKTKKQPVNSKLYKRNCSKYSLIKKKTSAILSLWWYFGENLNLTYNKSCAIIVDKILHHFSSEITKLFIYLIKICLLFIIHLFFIFILFVNVYKI